MPPKAKTSPIRVGILGMGFGASVHVPAFADVPGAQVAALADGGSGRARAIGKDHAPAARIFDDPFALLADPSIDAVSIAVPPTAQAAFVAAALDAGKHLICEKPVGTSLAECRALAAHARRAGRIAAVGFQFRFEQGLQSVIEAVRQERCGRIERLAVSWFAGRGRRARPYSWRCEHAQGGGMLREYGSHCFDYLTHMIGYVPDIEWARLSVRVPVRGMPARHVTAEDECDLICRLSDGGVATIALSNIYAVPTGHRLVVFGSTGKIVFEHRPPYDSNAPTATFTDEAGETLVLSESTGPVSAGTDSRHAAWRTLAERFIESIENGETAHPDLPTLKDAAAAWRMIEAAEGLCPMPAAASASERGS
jgi:predicted dehydrogenase